MMRYMMRLMYLLQLWVSCVLKVADRGVMCVWLAIRCHMLLMVAHVLVVALDAPCMQLM